MTWSRQLWMLLTVSALVLASCSLGSSDAVTDLTPGECFDDPTANGELVEEVETLPMVDCSEPHDNEAYAVFNLQGDAFPGDEALLEEGLALCLPLFEDYVGSTYQTSRLDLFPITPVAAGWADGDREVICALFDTDLSKLTGSMRDSGE